MYNENSTPPRGYLTEHLRQLINASNILTYKYDKPDNIVGGWSDDASKPTSRFVPYSVINPNSTAGPEGSLGDGGSEWTIPYSIRTYGASGDQTERQSDRFRKLVSEMERGVVLLGTEEWAILKITVPTIGTVGVNRQGASPVYTQYDTMLVWISKE